jgi:hypothetical protein
LEKYKNKEKMIDKLQLDDNVTVENFLLDEIFLEKQYI